MTTGKKVTTTAKNADYAKLQAQAKQKGLQPEEKAMIAKVAANRGITAKEARRRVTERLSEGRAVGGKGGTGGTKIGTQTITRYDSANPDTVVSTKTKQVGRKAYRKGKGKVVTGAGH